MLYYSEPVFNSKKIQDFDIDNGVTSLSIAYRLRTDWDSDYSMEEQLSALVQDPQAGQLTELVIGCWDQEGEDNAAIISTMIENADKLSAIRHLFIGDMDSEEQEISWIEQSTLSGLGKAFPLLETLGIRGANGLSLEKFHGPNLKVLAIESGGLPSRIIYELKSSELPSLEHLELWLGTEEYGFDGDKRTIKTLLQSDFVKGLTYLGLRNSEIVDDIAVLLKEVSLPSNLKVLDLSLGTLSDSGAEQLLLNEALHRLERLDLHHHYLSDEMMDKFKTFPISVHLDEQMSEDVYGDEVYRYTAVSE